MEPTHYQKELLEYAKSLDRDELIGCLVNAEMKAGDMAKRNMKLEKNNRLLASNLKKAVKAKKELKEENEELHEVVRDYEGVIPDDFDRAMPTDIEDVIDELKEKEAEATLENDKLRAEIKSLKPVSKNTEKEWGVVYKSMCKEIEELKKQIK